MGFRLTQGGDSNPLLPYEQAHAVLRNITDGVHIILLCARKDGIFSSLGGLYWLINEFFHGGRAPVAFVLTHFDAPDEGWWERNQDVIAEKTGIPVRSIPHACITTLQSGRDESKRTMKALLEKYANIVPLISLRLDFPSCMTTHPFDLANNCDLHLSDSTALMEQFSHWQENRRCNVVLLGEAGVRKSSVINLVAGEEVATTSAGITICTLDYCAHEINTGMQQLLIWDTMGFNLHIDSNKAIESAVRLVRTLSSQGGIDLLVFCKQKGRLCQSELNMYRLIEEFLCEGQVPVAFVVITHLESQNPMERWWEGYGKDMVKALGKDVIGHACITSLPLEDPDDHRHRRKLMQSSLAVRAMLEDCIPPRSTLAG